MRDSFVLVDFENVQPKDIGTLDGGPFKIRVFVGTNQGKVPLEMASALQAFGHNAEYIKIEGSGRNALDFHIAYYVGRLAAENPDSCFYLISKDTGFDPLIKHLLAKNIVCKRFKSVADVHSPPPSTSGSALEKIDAVIDNLARRKAARPRRVKTLRTTINALFRNQLTDEELDALVAQLTGRGVIRVVDGKVQYEQREQSGL